MACFNILKSKRSITAPPPSSARIEYPNLMFEEMRAANEWHLTPAAWHSEPRWSRVVMVAYCQLRSWIEYWVAEAAMEKR